MQQGAAQGPSSVCIDCYLSNLQFQLKYSSDKIHPFASYLSYFRAEITYNGHAPMVQTKDKSIWKEAAPTAES